MMNWLRQFVATPLLVFGAHKTACKTMGLTQEEWDNCVTFIDNKYKEKEDESI
jgi:hypothetical protein